MTSARRPQLDGRVLRLLPFFLVVFVGLSAWRLSQSPAPSPGSHTEMTELSGEAMGTTFAIKLADPVSPKELQRAERAVARSLAEVEQTMSTYRPDSELSRFNRSQVTGTPFPISAGFRAVMAVALQVGEASGGALDVTVAPIVDAWGFGPVPRKDHPPAAAVLARLKAHTGLSKVELTKEGLVKHDPALRCDLSAVAKGYAVDLVARRLSALGLRNYLVELGGELRARGQRPDGSLFRVGIERPTPGRRAVERALEVRDQTIATSGDYRNFFMEGDERRSHLIDPRTARPVTHDLASVTVLHAQAAVADAWASALLVLGPERGPALARDQALAALFIVHEGDNGFRSLETSAFARASAPSE